MALNGIDVSQWQNADLSGVPLDFLIARTTWGGGNSAFVDPKGDAHIQSARRRGKLFGYYHFGSSTSTPREQADYFVKHTEGYVGEGIPVLDYEDIGGSERFPATFGQAGALEFLHRVKDLTGVKPVIYCNASTARGLSQVAADDFGLWIASWGSNASGGYRDPGTVDPSPWPFAVLHQYTSRGRLSGYNGDLDLNVFHGDADAWRAYARGSGATPAPTPAPSGKTDAELAAEVWAGKHGNGDARKKSLGSRYDAVQAIVDSQAGSSRTHTVRAGETLSGIAGKYGTTWQELQRKNGIANANLIFPGQVLKV